MVVKGWHGRSLSVGKGGGLGGACLALGMLMFLGKPSHRT